MRILITSEFYLSGQSTHVLDLAQQLSKLHHQVQIVFTAVHSASFFQYYGPKLKKHGITYHVTKYRSEILQIVTRFKPDVIHSHSSTIFDLTRYIARQTQTPYVVTCHGLGFANPKYETALSRASKIIAVGPNSAQEIKRIYHEKVVIIPNGIDIDEFTPGVKEKNTNVYYVSRMDWSKESALKNLQKAVSRIPNMKLTVISNWHPPINQFHYIPWQTNLSANLKPANIVAGCGRTAREAMAAGCAVLLINSCYDGLIDEKLIDLPDFDFSGNICRYNYQQLATDLNLLVTNTRRLREIQAFSRKYATIALSSREMATKILAVYQAVIT